VLDLSSIRTEAISGSLPLRCLPPFPLDRRSSDQLLDLRRSRADAINPFGSGHDRPGLSCDNGLGRSVFQSSKSSPRDALRLKAFSPGMAPTFPVRQASYLGGISTIRIATHSAPAR